MLSNKVERITRLHVDEHGAHSTIVVYKSKSRKKGSKVLRPMEKGVRRLAKAHAAFSDSYLARHERSKKKKDGWLRDFGVNVLRASSKAHKQLR